MKRIASPKQILKSFPWIIGMAILYGGTVCIGVAPSVVMVPFLVITLLGAVYFGNRVQTRHQAVRSGPVARVVVIPSLVAAPSLLERFTFKQVDLMSLYELTQVGSTDRESRIVVRPSGTTREIHIVEQREYRVDIRQYV